MIMMRHILPPESCRGGRGPAFIGLAGAVEQLLLIRNATSLSQCPSYNESWPCKSW